MAPLGIAVIMYRGLKVLRLGRTKEHNIIRCHTLFSSPIIFDQFDVYLEANCDLLRGITL